MKDEELDRLRTSLLHAYDKPEPLAKRLANAMKDRIGARADRKASRKITVNPKKNNDAA